MDAFGNIIETIGLTIDIAGALVIVIGAVYSFVAAGLQLRRSPQGTYVRFRQRLGRAILLGLELLVAADIIRTVAVSPTIESVAVLGLIVLIRTFLSFTLEVEVSGRWPWAKNTAAGAAGASTGTAP